MYQTIYSCHCEKNRSQMFPTLHLACMNLCEMGLIRLKKRPYNNSKYGPFILVKKPKPKLTLIEKKKKEIIRCGKLKEHQRKFRAKLIGKKVEKLIIIKDLDRKNKKNEALLLCQCECGNLIEVPTGQLNTLSTKLKPKYSCGCLRRSWPRKRLIHPAQARLSRNISKKFHKTLKGEGSISWPILTGYDSLELRAHLESQFTPNMSWDNYGTYWVVDHIIPRHTFDQRNKVEVAMCWALPNLQPLERHKNNKKGSKIDCYSEGFYNGKLEEIRQFVKGCF